MRPERSGRRRSDPGSVSGAALASRPEEANLERLKPHRDAWHSEMPVAPLGQEWGIAAAGIEMAGTLG